MTKHISIIGLGGVGGYFGFKLASAYEGADDISIDFIARGETYELVKARGLTLISNNQESCTHPSGLFKHIKDIQKADFIFICVKEYDLEEICLQLKTKVRNDTAIIPLMSGVDVYNRIRNIISNGYILPACVYVASHIKNKGVIAHNGETGKIVVGKDPLYPAYNPQQLVDILKGSGVNVSYEPDPFPAIWTKFIFIASFGLVSARYNSSIGQICNDPALRSCVQGILREVIDLAKASAIELPENIEQKTFEKAGTFPFDTPTSLQIDIRSKKPQAELELFAGAIIGIGKKLSVPVPKTMKITAEILKANPQLTGIGPDLQSLNAIGNNYTE